ncbi:helix-turn-helix transcriptional regulator [Longispora sp. NPDC051575]|uniref:helix-turn-helix domain-containing protein n=1 Tax=Longispora sp. NPDC051575 TaxID=3154943 RepID=UPI003417194D
MVSDGRSTPYPLRSRLARHLRLLREESDLTIKAVGRRVGWSDSKMSRIETGLTGITPWDAERLLDVYRVTGHKREWMLGLIRGSRRDVLSAYVHFEAESASVLGYESMLFPGILQLPEYTRALIRSAEPTASPERINMLITRRIARQALLTSDDGPSFHLVVDESVLHRPIGSEQTLKSQLRRLLDLAELPSVTLRVFPFDAADHPALEGAFTVLRFRDELDPGIVALEHRMTTFYLDDSADVETYIDVFRRLNELALDPQDTVKLVSRLASGR